MKLRWLFAAMLVAAAAAAAAAMAIATHGTAQNAAKAPGSTADGVKVEGHWTLTLKNPDGRVVLVRRFHNEPTYANKAIATILARVYTPSYWYIELNSTNATGFNGACLSAGAPSGCLIIDPSDSYPVPQAFKTLTTSAGAFQSTIVLTGSITAQRNGVVDDVSTHLGICSPTVAPSTACGLSQSWNFTDRTLSTPISLVTGQQLLVTVTLSFT